MASQKSLKIESLDINDLVLDSCNARKHSQKNLKAIKGSLKAFGQQKPVVIDKKNIVIAGNGTVEAARALGWQQIDCVRTDLEGAEAMAFALADNRTAELAEWDDEILKQTLHDLDKLDFDIGDIGFDESEFLPKSKEGLTDDDEVPEVDENIHGVNRGDIWLLGNHRLMCGDSTKKEDVERLMAGEKADLWLTDPPYGVSYQAKIEGRGRTKASKIENDDHDIDTMAVFWQALAESAHFACSDKAPYYWFACQGGDQMMMMMSISRAGWKVRHELIWNKDQLVLGRCDYHYKHEPILYGWKQKGTHEWFGDRSQTSVIDHPRPKANDLHPTMKPVDLIAYLIGNSSKAESLVLETCGGSGSTLIACEKTNRKCYGMEIDPHYCSVIIERWQKFTGKNATKTP